MNGKRELKKIAVLVLVSLILMGLDRLGWMEWSRSVAEIILKPIRNEVSKQAEVFERVPKWILNLSKTQEKITNLERRIAELSVDAVKVSQVEQENQALRAWLETGVSGTRSFWPVRVVGRADEWLVAGGENEGLEKGAVVVTEAGVMVGKISEVGKFVSRVQLVTDNKSEIEVETSRGARGRLKGSGNELELLEVLQADSLEIGDLVVTSGAGLEFPAGMVIGEVTALKIKQVQVYKSARIKPFYENLNTNYLFVMK